MHCQGPREPTPRALGVSSHHLTPRVSLPQPPLTLSVSLSIPRFPPPQPLKGRRNCGSLPGFPLHSTSPAPRCALPYKTYSLLAAPHSVCVVCRVPTCSVCMYILTHPGPRSSSGLGSPASPRLVPVDAAACRVYRDPGIRNHSQVLHASRARSGTCGRLYFPRPPSVPSSFLLN